MKKLIGIITLFSFLFTLPVLAQHPASCASYVTFRNTGCEAVGIYTYDNRGRQKYINTVLPGRQWKATTVTNQKWTFLAGSGRFKQNWYSKKCENIIKTITSSPCIRSIKLVGVTSGRIYVQDTQNKEYILPNNYIDARDHITRVTIAGDRLGALTMLGKALVKEGGLHGPWVTVSNGARELILSGNRIGVITSDRKALVKEGRLNAHWVTVATNVRQLALSSNSKRIGIINTSYKAYVKQGALNAKWVHVSSNTSKLALAGYRIGFIDKSNRAYVKEGALNAKWFKISDQSRHISMTDTSKRIAVIGTKGNAWVKQGSLTAKWEQITRSGKITKIDLSNYMIGIKTLDKKIYYKIGGLDNQWISPKKGNGFSDVVVKY